MERKRNIRVWILVLIIYVSLFYLDGVNSNAGTWWLNRHNPWSRSRSQQLRPPLQRHFRHYREIAGAERGHRNDVTVGTSLVVNDDSDVLTSPQETIEVPDRSLFKPPDRIYPIVTNPGVLIPVTTESSTEGLAQIREPPPVRYFKFELSDSVSAKRQGPEPARQEEKGYLPIDEGHRSDNSVKPTQIRDKRKNHESSEEIISKQYQDVIKYDEPFYPEEQSTTARSAFKSNVIESEVIVTKKSVIENLPAEYNKNLKGGNTKFYNEALFNKYSNSFYESKDTPKETTRNHFYIEAKVNNKNKNHSNFELSSIHKGNKSTKKRKNDHKSRNFDDNWNKDYQSHPSLPSIQNTGDSSTERGTPVSVRSIQETNSFNGFLTANEEENDFGMKLKRKPIPSRYIVTEPSKTNDGNSEVKQKKEDNRWYEENAELNEQTGTSDGLQAPTVPKNLLTSESLMTPRDFFLGTTTELVRENVVSPIYQERSVAPILIEGSKTITQIYKNPDIIPIPSSHSKVVGRSPSTTDYYIISDENSRAPKETTKDTFIYTKNNENKVYRQVDNINEQKTLPEKFNEKIKSRNNVIKTNKLDNFNQYSGFQNQYLSEFKSFEPLDKPLNSNTAFSEIFVPSEKPKLKPLNEEDDGKSFKQDNSRKISNDNHSKPRTDFKPNIEKPQLVSEYYIFVDSQGKAIPEARVENFIIGDHQKTSWTEGRNKKNPFPKQPPVYVQGRSTQKATIHSLDPDTRSGLDPAFATTAKPRARNEFKKTVALNIKKSGELESGTKIKFFNENPPNITPFETILKSNDQYLNEFRLENETILKPVSKNGATKRFISEVDTQPGIQYSDSHFTVYDKPAIFIEIPRKHHKLLHELLRKSVKENDFKVKHYDKDENQERVYNEAQFYKVEENSFENNLKNKNTRFQVNDNPELIEIDSNRRNIKQEDDHSMSFIPEEKIVEIYNNYIKSILESSKKLHNASYDVDNTKDNQNGWNLNTEHEPLGNKNSENVAIFVNTDEYRITDRETNYPDFSRDFDRFYENNFGKNFLNVSDTGFAKFDAGKRNANSDENLPSNRYSIDGYLIRDGRGKRERKFNTRRNYVSLTKDSDELYYPSPVLDSLKTSRAGEVRHRNGSVSTSSRKKVKPVASRSLKSKDRSANSKRVKQPQRWRPHKYWRRRNNLNKESKQDDKIALSKNRKSKKQRTRSNKVYNRNMEANLNFDNQTDDATHDILNITNQFAFGQKINANSNVDGRGVGTGKEKLGGRRYPVITMPKSRLQKPIFAKGIDVRPDQNADSNLSFGESKINSNTMTRSSLSVKNSDSVSVVKGLRSSAESILAQEKTKLEADTSPKTNSLKRLFKYQRGFRRSNGSRSAESFKENIKNSYDVFESN